MFKAALLFAQKYPNLCTLKELNKKLILTIEDVSTVKRADEVLIQIENFIELPQYSKNES